ncbi:MAG TPA: hypothetical protein VLD19_14935, partial [Chitinophagaceae bacterium]|nr:hypothetical protein [Chitinophagaceae bacterium]
MKNGLLSIAACIFSIAMQAQKPVVFKTNDGAIRGYDPVAYFTAGMPLKGYDSLSYTWNGADWHFSSKSNLDSF